MSDGCRIRPGLFALLFQENRLHSGSKVFFFDLTPQPEYSKKVEDQKDRDQGKTEK